MPADNLTFARLTEDGTVVAAPADTTPPPPPPPMPQAATPEAVPEAAVPEAVPTPPPAMPTPVTPDPTAPPAAATSADTTPAAPPAMPGKATTMTAPAGKADGWQVDSYELRSFSDAVVRARAYLDAVQAKVDRMQGAELTPQLGTSPVGTQLAKKFDDRLNSADGLRAMLAEAMKRMEDFVTSAEKAARAYEELEESNVDTFDYNVESPPVKHHRG
jgi:hypothetical protein